MTGRTWIWCLLIALTLLFPAVASAHSTQGGVYEATVTDVTIGAEGLDISVVDQDAGLEIVSSLPDELVLLDGNDRPFARVGPDGSYRRSFADDGDGMVQWDRASEAATLKVAYPPMDDVPKAFSESDADGRTLVKEWSLPIQLAGSDGEIRGDLHFEPSSSFLAMLEYALTAGAIILMLGVFAWDARKRRRSIAIEQPSAAG